MRGHPKSDHKSLWNELHKFTNIISITINKSRVFLYEIHVRAFATRKYQLYHHSISIVPPSRSVRGFSARKRSSSLGQEWYPAKSAPYWSPPGSDLARAKSWSELARHLLHMDLWRQKMNGLGTNLPSRSTLRVEGLSASSFWCKLTIFQIPNSYFHVLLL